MSTEDDWTENATCRKSWVDPDWFFPSDAPVGKSRPNGELRQVYPEWRRAELVCAACPMWKQCLWENLDAEVGIFAGLNEIERQQLSKADLAVLTRRQPRALSTVQEVALYTYLRVGTTEAASEASGLPMWRVTETLQVTSRKPVTSRRRSGEDAA